MNLGLENKRVLVTGSTGGIGEGIAKCFAQEGAMVLINGRREGEAERVAAEIREAGGQALVGVGDLTIDEDVARIKDVLARYEAQVSIKMTWRPLHQDGWIVTMPTSSRWYG